jgi:uncharacterized protein (TIGR02271 family)
MGISHPQSVVGKDVVGADGEKIGKVEDLYVDTDQRQPEWAAVSTGFFGTHISLVPIAEASEEGDTVRVPYSKDQVKSAPHYDPGRQLSDEDEADLFRHYGRSYDGGDVSWGREAQTETAEFAERDTRDSDIGGRATDDAMTRSEERLRVGKERAETGRARLRKYVETEDVHETVPVSREEVRVEREPITDANRDEAMSGPEISEAEHEVTLTEEKPVVEKETVPVERVRLDKEQVTDEEEVAGQVRKERIETEGEGETEYPPR